jgi:hypothetical protein
LGYAGFFGDVPLFDAQGVSALCYRFAQLIQALHYFFQASFDV